MGEYINKEAVDVTLCNLIREYNREALGRESSAVFEALARFRYLPASNVRENVIRTQGDKLRAMSDVELAGFLTAVARKSAEKLCESLKLVDVDLSECDFGILTQTHLDWLKQEVDNAT